MNWDATIGEVLIFGGLAWLFLVLLIIAVFHGGDTRRK